MDDPELHTFMLTELLRMEYAHDHPPRCNCEPCYFRRAQELRYDLIRFSSTGKLTCLH